MQAVGYSITLNRLGRHEEARKLLTAAREQARTLGAEFWSVIAQYHLARSLVLAGRPDEARPLLDGSAQRRGAPMPLRTAIASLTSIARRRRSICCRETSRRPAH